ncbi:MAG: hypothetical protein Q7R73_01450 [bacterium]|nr:hypothetical protein [bacterium]
MADTATNEYENAARLAEAQNQDAGEEAEEEPDEPEAPTLQREKKMDWGTGFLMGMVALFFGVLSAIPGIGFILNGIGVGFIFLWWTVSGLKPPTLGLSSKLPFAGKKAAAALDPGEKASAAIEQIPVAGKSAAFFLPLILGIIPSTGVLTLPWLVWAIYKANS